MMRPQAEAAAVTSIVSPEFVLCPRIAVSPNCPNQPEFERISNEVWALIEEDARVVAEAGAFAVVLEAIAEPLAAKITKAVPIPTIGIGASAACDGQILVMEDMLGLSPRVPKFVKEFGEVGQAIEKAIRSYAEEVRTRNFPAAENTYDVKD